MVKPPQQSKKTLTRLNTSNWLSIMFCWLLIVGTVLVVMVRPVDPDMGWHIRNGLDILRYGVPRGDLYSYTMFGYPWISHEWLTDIWMYLLSSYFDWLTVSLTFASIVVAAYIIAAKVSKANWETVLITTLMAVLVAVPIIGIRVQMLTLLGLAVTLWILFRWRNHPKSQLIWYLAPLMLLWVNLHGGFFAGLVLIAVFGGAELLKVFLSRKFKRLNIEYLHLKYLLKLGGVWLVVFATTLINPYTWRVYDELRRTVFDVTVRQTISEWAPVSLASSSSYNLAIYTILLIALVIIYWKHIDLTKVIIGLCFFVLALSSWRNMPLFSLVTIPLLVEIITVAAPNAFQHLSKYLLIILLIMGISYLGWQRYQLLLFNAQPELFQEIGKYPYYAVHYIKENNLKGNLFNEYNWGGYLVWQLPEKPVFIDGRMAIWKTPTQEIFNEFSQISNNTESTKDILDKYDVGLVLIYANKLSKTYFLDNADKWKLVYQDDLAIIFQRLDLVSSSL